VCDIKKPVLIVLDDVHYIFDAPWFAEFFNSLLYLLNENTHLVLLARSSPAFPLWRLRSKQVLGVVDEDLLLFNDEETQKFLAKYRLDDKTRQEIFKKSFGRIGKLKSLAEAAREKRVKWSD
jgi:ATP/maltotriose-dependent transcriptional regulator MalT